MSIGIIYSEPIHGNKRRERKKPAKLAYFLELVARRI